MVNKIPVSHIEGALSDANIDNKLYGRKNGTWEEIIIPEPSVKHKIQVTLTEETNIVPLGLTVEDISQIDNVNIGNVQVQYDTYTLSNDGTALELTDTFPIGTKINVAIILGLNVVLPFYIEDAPKAGNGIYARKYGKWELISSSYTNTNFDTFTEDGEYNITLTDNSINYLQPYVYLENNVTWNLVVKNGIQTASSNGDDYRCKYSRKIGSLDWYQVEGPGLELLSNKYINVDLGTESVANVYLAPKNGALNLVMGSSAAYQSMYISNRSRGDIEHRTDCSTSGQYIAVLMYANNGDTLNYFYTMPRAGLDRFKFIYANSEVPMRERFPEYIDNLPG